MPRHPKPISAEEFDKKFDAGEDISAHVDWSKATKPNAPPRVYAKVVHLYAGLDLIGSKTSVTSRDTELEITPVGIRMTSKKTGRIVLLPWSNIKGCELLS